MSGTLIERLRNLVEACDQHMPDSVSWDIGPHVEAARACLAQRLVDEGDDNAPSEQRQAAEASAGDERGNEGACEGGDMPQVQPTGGAGQARSGPVDDGSSVSILRPRDLAANALSALSVEQEPVAECMCDNCGRAVNYDLIVPDEMWAHVSPKPVDGFKGGGVLCPECIIYGLTSSLSTAIRERDEARADAAEQSAKAQREIARATTAEALASQARADAIEAQGRIAELEKALRPFAEVAGEGNEDVPGTSLALITVWRTVHYAITLADFRLARATLTEGKQS